MAAAPERKAQARKKIGSCGPYQKGRALSEAKTDPRLLLASASATAPATPKIRPGRNGG